VPLRAVDLVKTPIMCVSALCTANDILGDCGRQASCLRRDFVLFVHDFFGDIYVIPIKVYRMSPCHTCVQKGDTIYSQPSIMHDASLLYQSIRFWCSDGLLVPCGSLS
jgi:hypothetical protein